MKHADLYREGWKQLNVRLKEADHEALMKLAQASGRSAVSIVRAQVVRHLTEEAVKKLIAEYQQHPTNKDIAHGP